MKLDAAPDVDLADRLDRNHGILKAIGFALADRAELSKQYGDTTVDEIHVQPLHLLAAELATECREISDTLWGRYRDLLASKEKAATLEEGRGQNACDTTNGGGCHEL